MTRIGILADIHMRSEWATTLEEELRWIVARFDENVRPDHVFVLGDIIQDGATRAADRRNVRRVAEILGERSYPVTYLLGNHDVINLSREELGSLLGQERFHGTVDVDGRSFLYLDSALTDVATPSGMLGPAQLSFAGERLATERETVVLVHHPIGDFDLSDNP